MIEIFLSPIQYILVVFSGFLVGFSLGLIGGGGSVLAVPLLLYLVGLAHVPSQYAEVASEYENIVDHIALGSTALAVGLNAYINAYVHYRRGNIRLSEGIYFTIPGVGGALVGSYVSHIIPGRSLLFFFGVFMIFIALMMLRHSGAERRSVGRVRKCLIPPIAFLIGFASGFFGIGGGFLIVPGLLFVGLSINNAVGTSLIAVGSFGLTSAIVYSFYGYLMPVVSLFYLIGGVVGGYIGSLISVGMPRDLLKKMYALIIIAVAIYIMIRNLGGLFSLV
ncbi:MAG: sulfite exporter TauE/SafE family protein [Sulfolobales archaeon]